jgi:hypothetical protein
MPSYPYLAYESDEAIEADELYGELDEADESDEAVRRRPQRRMGAPIRTPQRGGNIPPRPQAGFATRAELTATANRLDAKIGQLSTGVKALDGRVRALDSEQGKLRTRNVTTPVPGTGLTTNDKVVVDNGDSLSRILPMLLFSGAGNTGQSGSGGMFGGDNNTMMMLAMVMAMKP